MADRFEQPPDRLYAANAAAARFYATRLRASTAAMNYLRDHGIIHAAEPGGPWQLGYAAGRWTDLASHLLSSGFTADEVCAAGLGFIHRTSRNLLDRYRNRLMVPVTDAANRVVGFTARDLSGRASAKWLNGPETSLYKKRSLLYGLGQQLAYPPAGAGTPLVFVVEGAPDVHAIHHMATAHARPIYVVAPCGTHLTRDQLDLLQRVLPGAELALAFDGDDAGRRAIDRAYPVALTWPGKVSGVLLPHDQDPAELLAAAGPSQALDEIMAALQPLPQIRMTNTIRDLFRQKRITDPVRFAGDRLTAYRAIADLFVDGARVSRQMAEGAADQLGLDVTDVVRGVVEAMDGHGSEPEPAPPAAAPQEVRATVSAWAQKERSADARSCSVTSRHDPATGVTVWALGSGIGQHVEAGAAAAMAAEVAATVAVRTAPATGLQAARAAINAIYSGVHATAAGDASLIVISAYLSPAARHGVRFEIATVGDCRAYTVRAGQLAQITVDQVLGPPGSAASSVLTSSVREGHINVCPFEDGPLLVCNGTLRRALPEARLAAELAEMTEAQVTADRLADAAGTHDRDEAAVLLIHARNAPPFRITTTSPHLISVPPLDRRAHGCPEAPHPSPRARRR